MKLIITILLSILPQMICLANMNKRELQMAEDSIVWALISANTIKGRDACSQNVFMCKDSNAELGLAYIALNNHPASLSALSKISRYKIDAGLSEFYTCHLLDKGEIIKPFLMKLNSAELEKNCIKETLSIKKLNIEIIADLNIDRICNSKHEIERRIIDTIKAIDERIQCMDE